MSIPRIELRLQVVADNKVQVPGCEPTSSVTSPSASQRLRAHCACVYVDLADVLGAIPGARLEFGSNWSQGGVRQRWVVLPGVPQICCAVHPDYYGIIRSLCHDETPITDQWSVCDVIGQGFCPSPGFDRPAPQQVDPYLPEGQTPFGAGITLGQWVPPWQAADIPADANTTYPDQQR